jgi:hypothetical protein
VGFSVRLVSDSMIVELSGWDSVANLRRRVEVDVAQIVCVGVERRADLEALIDHRALGVGTHSGEKRPDRRRVGTMQGRGVPGKQFWAVPSGDGSRALLVVDLPADHDVRRLVLAVDDPDDVAAAIEVHRQS